MITYYTFVRFSPATPLGLIPASWSVLHKCSRCDDWVESDHLIRHALQHGEEVVDTD